MKKLLSLVLAATLLLCCLLSGCNTAPKTDKTNTLQQADTPVNTPNTASSNQTTDATLKEGAMILNCVKIISNGQTPAEATAAA